MDTTKAAAVLLAVDIGNSITNLGLLENGKIVCVWSATTHKEMTSDEVRVCIASFLSACSFVPDIKDGIVASVVPGLTDVWTFAIHMLTGRHPLVVGPGIKTGIKMRYNDPGEVGADRVADLAAAKESYEPPFLIVDLGTTTNFEVIDRAGVFIGGIIAPGLRLSAQAVSNAAAQLTTVSLHAPASVIGKNTREAMQSGVVLGEVALIDGLIDAVWRELEYKTMVIMTGKDAQAMAALSQYVTSVDENLTLRGLGVLYRLNRRL